jgi:hypothetical protein
MKRVKNAVVIILTSLPVNAEVPGTYDISSESPVAAMESVLIINKDGTGSLDSMMDKIEFNEANISDNQFDFSVTA